MWEKKKIPELHKRLWKMDRPIDTFLYIYNFILGFPKIFYTSNFPIRILFRRIRIPRYPSRIRPIYKSKIRLLAHLPLEAHTHLVRAHSEPWDDIHLFFKANPKSLNNIKSILQQFNAFTRLDVPQLLSPRLLTLWGHSTSTKHSRFFSRTVTQKLPRPSNNKEAQILQTMLETYTTHWEDVNKMEGKIPIL